MKGFSFCQSEIHFFRRTLRLVIATSRIDKYDGDMVPFHYNRHEDDKPVVETIPALDFIGRLIQHIRKTLVSRYNQTPHSSLAEQSSQKRFFSEPEQIRRLTEDQIEKSFLLEIERRVSPDCVVVIDRVEYEVHYRYAKQRIRLSEGGGPS